MRGGRFLVMLAMVVPLAAACEPAPPSDPPPPGEPPPARVTPGTDHLDPGQGLYGRTNDSLRSANGQYTLAMQADGNLVLYVGAQGRVLWSSDTAGNRDAYAAMRMDGDLVVYSSTNVALWASGTHSPGARVVLGDDGNVIIFSSANDPLWATNTYSDRLLPGETLVGSTNQHIQSPSGDYALVMQDDGNLVLYRSGGSWLWFSNTAWQQALRLVMRSDGNLVIVASNNVALWESYTYSAGAHLVMQDDGNAVIYSTGGQALWSTHTAAPLASP